MNLKIRKNNIIPSSSYIYGNGTSGISFKPLIHDVNCHLKSTMNSIPGWSGCHRANRFSSIKISIKYFTFEKHISLKHS